MKSDSLLVIGQVTSEYQAKDPQLSSYLEYDVFLKATFSTFKLVHVPRDMLVHIMVKSRKHILT